MIFVYAYRWETAIDKLNDYGFGFCKSESYSYRKITLENYSFVSI